MTEAIIGLGGFLFLSLLRIPLAFSMAIIGFAGIVLLLNFGAAGASIAQTAYETGMQYSLSIVPLFILMGNLVVKARLSEDLFDAAYALLGHRRGGLAMSTIVACAGFGAICGSSIATSATFTKVAYPSMRRMGYKDSLSASCVITGGTLGIIIPPSVVLVLYGIMTNISIPKLFAASLVPGILMTMILCFVVAWVVRKDPAAGPAGERMSWSERLAALRKVWAVLLLFAVVMGGMYGGVFTATEGAAIGAGGALCFTLYRKALTLKGFVSVCVESVSTTAMLFMILIGAFIFANFINYTTMPSDLLEFIKAFNLHPALVIAVIFLIYIVLGTAMEEISVVLLTVPIFLPIVIQQSFDPLWFGVSIVIVTMIGMVSPPVGMNLFVVRGMLREVPMSTMYRGVLPFVVGMVLMLPIMIFFPGLATWLPSFVK